MSQGFYLFGGRANDFCYFLQLLSCQFEHYARAYVRAMHPHLSRASVPSLGSVLGFYQVNLALYSRFGVF